MFILDDLRFFWDSRRYYSPNFWAYVAKDLITSQVNDSLKDKEIIRILKKINYYLLDTDLITLELFSIYHEKLMILSAS